MSRRSKSPSGLACAAPLFAALGDDTRLALVAWLCEGGSWSTARLTARSEVTRQAVTKHLQVLADAGLVRNTRVGRERIWALEPQKVAKARRALDEISRLWDEKLDRLATYVEK